MMKQVIFVLALASGTMAADKNDKTPAEPTRKDVLDAYRYSLVKGLHRGQIGDKDCSYPDVIKLLQGKSAEIAEMGGMDVGSGSSQKTLTTEEEIKSYFDTILRQLSTMSAKTPEFGDDKTDNLKKFTTFSVYQASVEIPLRKSKNYWTIMSDVYKDQKCPVNHFLAALNSCAAEHANKLDSKNSQQIGTDAAGDWTNSFWYAYTGHKLGTWPVPPADVSKKVMQCLKDREPKDVVALRQETKNDAPAHTRDPVYFDLCRSMHQDEKDECDQAEKILDCIREHAKLKEDDPIYLAGPGSDDSADSFLIDSCPSSCFPGSSNVLTREGFTPMSSLQQGQEIMGPSGFEPVLGFLHKSARSKTPVVSLELSTGETLSATAEHLVFNAHGEGITMKSITVGTDLSALSLESGHTAGKVLSITREKANGLYVPLTMSGTLLVDGVMVSAYASPNARFSNPLLANLHITHALAHGSLAPIRTFLSAMHYAGVELEEESNATPVLALPAPVTA